MSSKKVDKSRRRFIKGACSVAALGVASPRLAISAKDVSLLRAIPSTGELIPAIGMGSWITFNVGNNKRERGTRVDVLRAFFKGGGALVDSSPMYGSSEAVIGHCLGEIGGEPPVFSATKVWTSGRERGIRQMKESAALWGEDAFDLMQVHNLMDWETHLETLKAWKKDGRVRYIGVTTSHGRRQRDIEDIMRTDKEVDFVQFTYNIATREAERRLLPAAADNGKAVIINRPFDGGRLFRRVSGKPLPEWAAEIDCANWAQFFLKYVLSHPAVTCPIPATSRVDHMLENIGALKGRLPDPSTRQRMATYFEQI